MSKTVYTVYSEEADMTFIMQDNYNNGQLVETKVKGFYFGFPDEKATEQFYGHLKAEF